MTEPLNDQQKADLFLGIHENALDEWNQSIARELAEADNLILTDTHFEVLNFIRDSYVRFGPIKNSRTLTQALETRFATLGGRKYLYLLFPKGPVAQGCRLACVPSPPDCVDASFGTAA